MLGIGLVMMTVMFFGMFAVGGGPHHMADIYGERLQKTVQTDHSHGQTSGGQQRVTYGGHDHIGIDAGVGNAD